MNKTVGYARVSTTDPDQTPSLQEQERLIRELAENSIYSNAPWECCISERRSASEYPWYKRPDFMRLWRNLNPGDFLLVWRLNRIERMFHPGNAFIADAQKKNINVHDIARPYDVQDINDCMIMTFEFFGSNKWVNFHSESRKTALARCKREGRPTQREPAIGKQYIYDDRGILREVWAPWICAAIREVVRRRERGESARVIAFDLDRQMIPSSFGKLVRIRDAEGRKIRVDLLPFRHRWVRRRRECQKAIDLGWKKTRFSYDRIHQAVRLVEQMKEDGTYQDWCRETGGDSQPG